VVTTTDTTTSFTYSVIAYNAAGNSAQGDSNTTTGAGALIGTGSVGPINSGTGTVATGTAGPTGLTQTINADKSVTLSWTAMAGATGYVVTVNGKPVTCAVATAPTCTILAVSLSTGVNTFAVSATALHGNTTAVTTQVTNGRPLAPVARTAGPGPAVLNSGNQRSMTLTWANSPANVNNVSGITLTWNGGSSTFAPTATGTTILGLKRAQDYTFNLTAISALGNSPQVQVTGVTAP
jgi:hypothetical protein